MHYRPVDLSNIQTYSLHSRKHKTVIGSSPLPSPGASAKSLIDSLPDFLGAKSLRQVVREILQAKQSQKAVVAAMGAHVIKVGCGPIIIDLIERGIITAVACNGAFAIHDIELALYGETSEDVSATIKNGTFGMVSETMMIFQDIVAQADLTGRGLGEAIADTLSEAGATNSIFLAAKKMNIPACVHVALGTDTVHMMNLNFAALAEASMYDFRLLCSVVSNLGVWINIGSAVILPEVFLKAVTVARNLGSGLDDIFTANFDMIQHYRPRQNVLTRPTERGVAITGHHEIMLPLLRQAILESS